MQKDLQISRKLKNASGKDIATKDIYYIIFERILIEVEDKKANLILIN
jgi:hypothetical protein